MALKDKKIPLHVEPDKEAADEIRARVKGDTLSCAEAFSAAQAMDISPLKVGQTADLLGIHLSHCQLGLFGYPGHEKGWAKKETAFGPLPEEVEAAIRRKAGREGSVTCLALWEVAELYSIPRMAVGFASDRLGMRITGCQLGAF